MSRGFLSGITGKLSWREMQAGSCQKVANRPVRGALSRGLWILIRVWASSASLSRSAHSSAVRSGKSVKKRWVFLLMASFSRSGNNREERSTRSRSAASTSSRRLYSGMSGDAAPGPSGIPTEDLPRILIPLVFFRFRAWLTTEVMLPIKPTFSIRQK